jgi:hypothetical protein
MTDLIEHTADLIVATALASTDDPVAAGEIALAMALAACEQPCGVSRAAWLRAQLDALAGAASPDEVLPDDELPCGIPANWREHSEPMIRHWAGLVGQLCDAGGHKYVQLEYQMLAAVRASAAPDDDEPEPAGPDYDSDAETAWEAQRDLDEQEAMDR